MTVVLESSALLAYLRDEPGAEVVDGLLADVRMTSANWAEVVQEDLQALGLRVEPFLAVDGERACLSLGLRLGLTVVTCDRARAQLPLVLEAQLLH